MVTTISTTEEFKAAEKRLKQIRGRGSYLEFKSLATDPNLTMRSLLGYIAYGSDKVMEAFETGDKALLLKEIWRFRNAQRKYGSETNAGYALESMEQVIEDLGDALLRKCDNCHEPLKEIGLDHCPNCRVGVHWSEAELDELRRQIKAQESV